MDKASEIIQSDLGIKDPEANPTMTLIAVFHEITHIINDRLTNNKLSKAKGKSNTYKLNKKFEEDPNRDMRKVRTLGEIKFNSVVIPRVATEKTIVYRTPSWVQRGHIRHLSSGKEVYVKECVKHRKGMDRAPAQVIFNLAKITVNGKSFDSFKEACKYFDIDIEYANSYMKEYELNEVDTIECILTDKENGVK